MRRVFKKMVGQQITVTATVSRFSKAEVGKGVWLDNVLLVNVCDTDGKYLTDHFWATMRKKLTQAKLQTNDRISFSGVVTEYKKYDKAKQKEVTDYKLTQLDDIKKISHKKKKGGKAA